VQLRAAMIVVANGTMYGSGAVINPVGTLDDAQFEVVAIKKISAMEIFKMRFSHAEFNPEKTVLYQTNRLHILSKRRVHFQVDGEYIGKVKSVEASLLPAALQVIVPKEPTAKSS
jgi:diacylglycerol kinase family enzyme